MNNINIIDERIKEYFGLMNYIPALLERYKEYTKLPYVLLDKIRTSTKEEKLIVYCIGIVLEPLHVSCIVHMKTCKLRTLKKRLKKHGWNYVFNNFCAIGAMDVSNIDEIKFDDIVNDLHVLSDKFNQEKETNFTLEMIYDAWDL